MCLPTRCRFAAVVILPFLWAAEIGAEDKNSAGEFRPIFDGKTLKGWHAVPKNSIGDWSVREGVLVGKGSAKRLTYLVLNDKNLVDFEFKFAYRMKTNGNSGVEIHARVDKTGKRPFEGYHVDFGHVGIGPQVLGAWDFHFAKRREYPCHRGTRLVINADGTPQSSKIPGAVQLKDIKKRDWNAVHVVARGKNFRFSINGKPAAEFTDHSPQRLKSGFLGLQLHDKGMIVEFKDLKLRRF